MTRRRPKYSIGIEAHPAVLNDLMSITRGDPIIPFDVVGMPAPGPAFVRYAEQLVTKPEDMKVLISILHEAALYHSWYSSRVIMKNQEYAVNFIPGHIWRPKDNSVTYGPTRAKIMVIGKLPGIEEMRKERNLIGKSGEVLIRVLNELGYTDYEDWYVTNLVKFPNPAPQVSNALAPDWLKTCRPLLQMELRLVKPDFILCLGSEAGKELFGMPGAVKNATGKVFDYKIPLNKAGETEEFHHCKVMVSLHPAAVARTPDLMPQLRSSVGLFCKLVQDKLSGEDDLECIVADTEEVALIQLNRILEETKDGGVIAVDCEWEGQQPGDKDAWLRTIQLCHTPSYGLCLVMRNCSTGTPNLCNNKAILEKLREIFKNTPERHIRGLGHFHRADLPWLIHYGLDLRPNFEVPADENTGPEETRYLGGFDTGAASHAVCETDDFKLEVLASRYAGIPRYDMKLQEAKKALCKKLKIKQGDLTGYGAIPDEILYPYAIRDVIATRRLFDVYNGVNNGEPGLLDRDMYGNNSRRAFWISMRAAPACLEMEMTGILVDKDRAEAMMNTYRITHQRRLEELKEKINWPNFNSNSPYDCRELLFGVKYRKQTDKTTGLPKQASPSDAILCNLMPVKCTAKAVKKSWRDLEENNEAYLYSPSTDKETLGILYHSVEDSDAKKAIVKNLRDVKFIKQILKSTLRPPALKDGKDEIDEDGENIYEKGLLSYVGIDKRIRTHIWQTLESGRYASSSPNLQNLCVDAQTEFLTKRGWILAPDLLENDEVAQYWPDTRMVNFVKPSQLIRQKHVGQLIHIRTNKQIDMLVTPEHRCLLRNRKTGRWFETTAERYIVDHHHIHAGNYSGGSLNLSKDMVTWLCAVQADGSYLRNANSIVFIFRKQRKINRLISALDSLSVDYTRKDKNGLTKIYIKTSNDALINETKRLLGPKKCFGSWLLDYNRETLDLFAEEVLYWDGLSTRLTEYSSSNKVNSDWIQILWTLSGIRARMRTYNTNPKAKMHYIVDIPRIARDHSIVSEPSIDKITWNDFVYCVTVPSEFIVTRRNGKTSITGNSKRREADYKQILGDQYTAAIRTIFRAAPGHVLIEADYVAAELAGMAWMSSDPTMIDHVSRTQLPESDPNYYDIHSAVAVEAFKLDCLPTKKGLASISKLHLRVAAKNVIFGYAYGRGAAAIALQAKEEGVNITIAEAQALINGLINKYPMLPIYFGEAYNRPVKPGWTCNGFGRYRRFQFTTDHTALAELGRQSMNYNIQSLVADAMSRALDHLYCVRNELGLNYKILLQIHDAVLLEVPIPELELVYNKILPMCMCERVPIYPANLDGKRIEGRGPYYLGIDKEIFVHWGEKIKTVEMARQYGIPESFAHAA